MSSSPSTATYHLFLLSPLDFPIYSTTLPSSRFPAPPPPSSAPSSSSAFAAYSSTAFSHHPSSSTSSLPSLAAFASPPAASAFGGMVQALVGGGSSSRLPEGETPTGVSGGTEDARRRTERHVPEMIAHAALDALEQAQFLSGAMYHKSIDCFNEWTVSAFITPGNIRFILLHEVKNDDGIRLFFAEVWETYLKHLLNPFYQLNSPITSAAFDARVRASAKKHL